MTVMVLDASIALSWCFEDEWTPHSDEILTQVRDGGALITPLWELEIVNVLVTAERRQRLTRSVSARHLNLLSTLPLRLTEHDPQRSDVMSLARSHSLSAYDAHYLLTAMQSALPLATLDRALIDAARATGTPVLAPPEV